MTTAAYLFDLVDDARTRLVGSEILLASLASEESDFVRFNRARVRQAMTIRQSYLTLSLIAGKRQDTVTLSLGGAYGEDRERVRVALDGMRASLPAMPEDPYLLYSTEPEQSERIETSCLPAAGDALDVILDAAKGTDFVGIFAAGPVRRVFASSLGHRFVHEVSSYQLDFSLYHARDKAAKGSLAAFDWNPAAVQKAIADTETELAHLTRPPKTLATGAHRAYLAPGAVAEIVAMLSWGGVSEKAQRTKTSSLQKLVSGEAQLSEKISLRENIAAGLAPAFDDVGFSKPGVVSLVDAGKHSGAMVSARTGKEYGIDANGASPEEELTSADLAAGTLAEEDVLSRLGTGVYVKNLWYLGFSDRPSARMTGMTRFATLWVEEGRVVAPLDVMRFDDGLFRMLGENLVDLTASRLFRVSPNTYGARSVETTRVPGALLSELLFTL
ncbi:MAG TPA: metallopeptidase TldD-related protein [Polyangiaceae bacterium]|jgi:predicted Zn-dependent protease|nr:metallopeptidase TldD-related protein [Polyangiaceae bacterium]